MDKSVRIKLEVKSFTRKSNILEGEMSFYTSEDGEIGRCLCEAEKGHYGLTAFSLDGGLPACLKDKKIDRAAMNLLLTTWLVKSGEDPFVWIHQGE